MKFCEECGAQLDDEAVFCEECGTRVELVQDKLTSVSEKPIKTKNSKKPFVIIALVLMCVAAGVGFMIWTGKIGNSKPKSSETNLASSDESTTEDSTTESKTEEQTTEESTIESTTEPTTESTTEAITEQTTTAKAFNADKYIGVWYDGTNTSIGEDGGAELEILSITEEKVVFNYNSYQSAPALRVASIENIEANIVNGKAEFAFEYDSWGNAGHGYIEFFDDKISVRIEITYLEPSSMWDVGGEVDFEISNKENTVKGDKGYIEEYLKIVEENGYEYTYDFVNMEPVKTPLLVAYSGEGAGGGLLGEVYMYTDNAGLQTFDCMAISYEISSNYLKTAYYGESKYREVYYYITDDGVSQYGKTESVRDMYDNYRYYVNENEVDEETYEIKCHDWFMYDYPALIENGQYSYDEIVDILSLLKS